MVKSNAVSVIGEMRGINFCSYQVLALQRHEDDAAQHAGGKGNAEVDHHAPENVDHADLHDRSGQAKIGRQHGDEEPGEEAVEKDLCDAVERDQPGGVFAAALGEFIPHQHHRNAAGDPDQDEAHHVVRVVAQEEIARKNMRIGPTTQFCTSDNVRMRLSAKTFGSCEYFTFASGGYIMRMSPMAIGRFVVPTVMGAKNPAGSEITKWPRTTPRPMAAKIQTVR
jgi:hypothetical protein